MISVNCRTVNVHSGSCKTCSRYDALTAHCLVMHFRQLAQSTCGLLGSQIALRLAEHLVADHELLDGGRAQQRRVEVGVELPVVKR